MQKTKYLSIIYLVALTVFSVSFFNIFLNVKGHQDQAFASGNFHVSFVESGKPAGTCVRVPNGNRYFTYDITATNSTGSPYKINYLAFHSNTSGCGAYDSTIGSSFEKISGKTDYQPGESGNLTLRYDTNVYNCGRTQYDAGFFQTDTTYSSTVFLGVVVDYGVDCPVSTPPPAGGPTPTPISTPTSTPTPTPISCIEDATVILSGLPSVLNSGQIVVFNASINNTGNTWWYHGGYFQFVQKSGFNINPTYGHYTPSMYSGDVRDFTFTLTAPIQPGSYAIQMQNVHRAGADYEKNNSTICRPAVSNDVYFGQIGVANFIVLAPSPTPISTPTPTPIPTPTPTFTPTPTPDPNKPAPVSAPQRKPTLIPNPDYDSLYCRIYRASGGELNPHPDPKCYTKFYKR